MPSTESTSFQRTVRLHSLGPVLTTRPGEMVAVEIETGKSDTKENVTKIAHADFDRVVPVTTSPAASEVCRKALAEITEGRQCNS